MIFQENAVYKDIVQKQTKITVQEDDQDGDTTRSPIRNENTSSSPVPPFRGNDVIEDTEMKSLDSPPSYHLVRDRGRRESRPPRRFDDEDYYAEVHYTTEDGEAVKPSDYQEARIDRNWREWSLAMDEEMSSQDKNHTWIIVKKPDNQRVIGSRWIYKYKMGTPGVEEPRFKARLVAKGYAQREGIDYHEIFAPVLKHVSIRILLSIVAQENLELEQLDVKTAFLHGELKEKIYMSPT